jgi:hypothetical protein
VGAKVLNEQTRALEEEAIKFEIALPERPPSHVSVPIDPESMQDFFMFNIIFKGIQDVIDLHIRGIIEAIRNDNFRKLLLGFWEDEIEMYERTLKYGKIKGWVKTPPIYNEPQ